MSLAKRLLSVQPSGGGETVVETSGALSGRTQLITLSGSNRLLIVVYSFEDSGSGKTITATFNGVAMAEAVEGAMTSARSQGCAIYYVVEADLPANGTYTAEATVLPSPPNGGDVMTWVQFSDAPSTLLATAEGTSTSTAVDVTATASGSGNLLIVGASNGSSLATYSTAEPDATLVQTPDAADGMTGAAAWVFDWDNADSPFTLTTPTSPFRNLAISAIFG